MEFKVRDRPFPFKGFRHENFFEIHGRLSPITISVIGIEGDQASAFFLTLVKRNAKMAYTPKLPKQIQAGYGGGLSGVSFSFQAGFGGGLSGVFFSFRAGFGGGMAWLIRIYIHDNLKTINFLAGSKKNLGGFVLSRR